MLSRLFLLAALMALLSAVTARPPSDLRPLEIRAEAGAARRNPTNKPVAPQEEAIRLYDKMDYKGYNLTYGPLMRCESLDVFGRSDNSAKTPWISAEIIIPGACCWLYKRFHCYGDGARLGGRSADLEAHGLSRAVRSVWCAPDYVCEKQVIG